MAKLYRIKDPGQHALRDPESNIYVVPDASRAYPADHPLVRAYPYLFESDEDRVEDASAAPGTRRRAPRGRS